MAKHERETADMEAFCKRVLIAISNRANDGDMESVESLNRLVDCAELQLNNAVVRLKRKPWRYSWADIARALGVTRQAAQQRFGGA